MKKISESLIIEKKSKFYGYLYELDSLDEVNSILDSIRSSNKGCKHICYAYKFNVYEKKSDDKEPSGCAGMPILSVINRNNLDRHLIVVVRYFGGKLLGKGLLTRCYLKCSSNLIK